MTLPGSRSQSVNGGTEALALKIQVISDSQMNLKRATARRTCEMSTALRRIIWWVFTGNRGGTNRARIVVALKERPLNTNQLSQMLEMDYKTVRHHLTVLLKNHLILTVGEGYGSMYFLSPELEQEYEEFLRIWERIGSK